MSVLSKSWQVFQYGMDGYDMVNTYKDKRQTGSGVAGSLGAVGVNQALWLFAPSYQWTKTGVDIAGAIGGAVKGFAASQSKGNIGIQKNTYRGNIGGVYNNSNNAATLRQKSMMALEGAGSNVNSVLGNEARTYYRGL